MEEENWSGSAEEGQEKINPKELVLRFGDRKIEAIKYVREQTGLGLKDAKDIVDAAYAGNFYNAPDMVQEQKVKIPYTQASETYAGRSTSPKSRLGIVLLITCILLVLTACAYFLLFS